MKYAMTMAVGFFIGLFVAGVEVNAHARPRPMVCGDVNADAAVTVSDALRTLAKSVGLDVRMRCNNRKRYHDD
jgi:hypothetical protein